MSKSRPHELMKPAVAPNPNNPPALLQKIIQTFTALSLFFVVMTPVAYFNGRAFHDGWYEQLHLDQSMFPLDTAGMLTEGAVAWGDALAVMADAAGKGLIAHWSLFVLMIFCGGLVWAALKWISHRLGRERAKRMVAATPKPESSIRRLIAAIVSPVLVLGLSVFAVYELLFALTFAFAILALPFYRLGRYEAKVAADNNFVNSPVVTVKPTKGDPVERKEIGCGPQFCGLWGSGHASFISLSAITWGDAPPPDH